MFICRVMAIQLSVLLFYCFSIQAVGAGGFSLSGGCNSDGRGINVGTIVIGEDNVSITLPTDIGPITIGKNEIQTCTHVEWENANVGAIIISSSCSGTNRRAKTPPIQAIRSCNNNLIGHHSGCTHTGVSASNSCGSASFRYCRSRNFSTGNVMKADFNTGLFSLACANHGNKFDAPFSCSHRIGIGHDGFNSVGCTQGAANFCRSKGFIGGIAVEDGGRVTGVTCLPSGNNTKKFLLNPDQISCTYRENWNDTSCRQAANSYCQKVLGSSSIGFSQGWIPQGWTYLLDIVCVPGKVTQAYIR